MEKKCSRILYLRADGTNSYFSEEWPRKIKLPLAKICCSSPPYPIEAMKSSNLSKYLFLTIESIIKTVLPLKITHWYTFHLLPLIITSTSQITLINIDMILLQSFFALGSYPYMAVSYFFW